MTDSELTTLQEKVKRLTHDRDVAMKMADRTHQLLQNMKTEKENYKKLWEHAERRAQKSLLSDVSYLEGIPVPIETKKKRTVSDWIWTAIFSGAAIALVYVVGWVLVWPKD